VDIKKTAGSDGKIIENMLQVLGKISLNAAFLNGTIFMRSHKSTSLSLSRFHTCMYTEESDLGGNLTTLGSRGEFYPFSLIDLVIRRACEFIQHDTIK